MFVRIRPKYGSRRTIDIAPFPKVLLSGHLAATSGRECSCDRSAGGSACEGTGHVFLGRPSVRRGQDARIGVHQRRSGYAAWIFGRRRGAGTRDAGTSPRIPSR